MRVPTSIVIVALAVAVALAVTVTLPMTVAVPIIVILRNGKYGHESHERASQENIPTA
jgi:hypothetical protein